MVNIEYVCFRCGQKCIFSKTWIEETSGAKITHHVWICPDKECQKIVEQTLKEKREKAELQKRDREEKALARKDRTNRSRIQLKNNPT